VIHFVIVNIFLDTLKGLEVDIELIIIGVKELTISRGDLITLVCTIEKGHFKTNS